MILLFSVCDYEAVSIKEDGERDVGWVRVQRTYTVLRDRLRGLGHILAS